MNDKNELYPKRRFVCSSLRKAFYFKCFVLSSMIFGCVVVAAWCQLFTPTKQQQNSGGKHPSRPRPSGQTEAHSQDASAVFIVQGKTLYIPTSGPCDDGYAFIPIAFATMLYLLYLMECWHYRSRLDQIGKSDVEFVYDYVDRLKTAFPIVWWQAVSYHYMRRTRHITRYRNGDAVVANQVYYERVNSKTATAGFLYQNCGVRDISKRLIGLERFPVTKVRLTKSFVFTTVQAANEFEDQRATFFQDNELVDDYMEIREGMDLMNVPFRDHILAFPAKNRQPWFYSNVVYWLFSILLLSWPLRVFIDCRTAHVHFQVTKLFGTNYLPPMNRYSTADRSATNLPRPDRCDDSATTDPAYFIVPSYSEAMLMELAPGTVVADTWHTGNQQNCNLPTLTDRFKRTLNDWNHAFRPAQKSRSLIFARRSRSLTFAKKKPAEDPGRPTAIEHDVSPDQPAAPRSVSFGGVCFSSGQQYATAPLSAMTTREEEPPPSYATAIQSCQSANSPLIDSRPPS